MGHGANLTEPSTHSSGGKSGTPVALFGGPADGRVVDVQFVDDRVAIYRSWTDELVVRAADAPAEGGEFLGIYQFVGPRGPEQPVFVHRVGAQRRIAR